MADSFPRKRSTQETARQSTNSSRQFMKGSQSRCLISSASPSRSEEQQQWVAHLEESFGKIVSVKSLFLSLNNVAERWWKNEPYLIQDAVEPSMPAYGYRPHMTMMKTTSASSTTSSTVFLTEEHVQHAVQVALEVEQQRFIPKDPHGPRLLLYAIQHDTTQRMELTHLILEGLDKLCQQQTIANHGGRQTLDQSTFNPLDPNSKRSPARMLVDRQNLDVLKKLVACGATLFHPQERPSALAAAIQQGWFVGAKFIISVSSREELQRDKIDLAPLIANHANTNGFLPFFDSLVASGVTIDEDSFAPMLRSSLANAGSVRPGTPTTAFRLLQRVVSLQGDRILSSPSRAVDTVHVGRSDVYNSQHYHERSRVTVCGPTAARRILHYGFDIFIRSSEDCYAEARAAADEVAFVATEYSASGGGGGGISTGRFMGGYSSYGGAYHTPHRGYTTRGGSRRYGPPFASASALSHHTITTKLPSVTEEPFNMISDEAAEDVVQLVFEHYANHSLCDEILI